jgi:predicted permease
MDSLLSDIRFALRSLGKSRMFTVVAVLSLALGIGANVTVFSIVNALAFKPLPYSRPDRLVDLHEASATKLCSGCSVGTSYPTFTDWRANARSFTGMGAYLARPFVVSGTEKAERVSGALVSANVFELLGVHVVRGRGLVAEDDRAGARPVVLLSDALWKRLYASDSNIVGRTIRIGGVSRTVIGVMPAGFKFPEVAELWLPFAEVGFTGAPRDDRGLGVVARLAPGVTIPAASAEMAAIAKSIELAHPETQKEWSAQAEPLRAEFGAVPPEMYFVMLGAVGFVLLIVCANVAGLLLARGAGRQREIAVRLALGATRARIIRHLLTESTMLALAGGGLGLLVSAWGVDLVVHNIGRQMPFYVTFGVDGLTLAFCLGVSLLTGIIFGLVPALRVSSPDVHTTLKESSTIAHRSRLRSTLVIGELALSLILLAGAGELTKSFVRVSTPESGYDDRDLLSANVEFFDAKYADPNAVRLELGQILDRLAALPGVTDVATDRTDFLAGFGHDDKVIRVEGLSHTPDGVSPRFSHVVSPGYFAAVRLLVLAGRRFDARDGPGAMPVVMINQRMAEQLWPGESPLGRRIKLGAADTLHWLTVVGIVGDVGNLGKARNYAYVPAAQATGPTATLLLRAQGESSRLAPAVRTAVRAVDADIPVLDLETIAHRQHVNYLPYEVYAIAMGTFAAFAILLAAVGLYGVIAYNTAERTKEIGVRMALGAEASHVVALIAAQGGRLIMLGIVVGIAGAAALLRVLSSLLFGASPVDLPIFAAVSFILTMIAFVATWLPARRAAAVSPLEALRAE